MTIELRIIRTLALLALLSLLLGYCAVPAQAQAPPALAAWAGTGPVKYVENTAQLVEENAGPGGAACMTLGDGICVGTIYARNTHRRPETWWTAVERGDLQYWTGAARLAREHGLLLKLRLAPLLVWNVPGHPSGIQTWGRGWIDDQHRPTVERYLSAVGQIDRAVREVWPHVIWDAPMMGRVGEPRIDDVPVAQRNEYTQRQNSLIRQWVEVVPIERTIVFLWTSGGGHPTGGNYGFDYLDNIQSLGTPAGSRQDGYGSRSKYAEYDLLKNHSLGARLLSREMPTWFEQWGGSIRAWHEDPVVTAVGPPSVHMARADGRYGAGSVAFMGWRVDMDPNRTQNVRDVRAHWERSMQFGPAQIESMIARWDDTSPPGPPPPGPPPGGGSTYNFSVADTTGSAYLCGVAVKPEDIESGIAFDPVHFHWIGSREAALPTAITTGFVCGDWIEDYNVKAVRHPEGAPLSAYDVPTHEGFGYRFDITGDMRVTVSYPPGTPPPPDTTGTPGDSLLHRILRLDMVVQQLQEALNSLRADHQALTARVDGYHSATPPPPPEQADWYRIRSSDLNQDDDGPTAVSLDEREYDALIVEAFRLGPNHPDAPYFRDGQPEPARRAGLDLADGVAAHIPHVWYADIANLAISADSVLIVADGPLTTVHRLLKDDPALQQRTQVLWLGCRWNSTLSCGSDYNSRTDTTATRWLLNDTADNGGFEGAVTVVPENVARSLAASPDQVLPLIQDDGARSVIAGRVGAADRPWWDVSLVMPELWKEITTHGGIRIVTALDQARWQTMINQLTVR